MKFRGVHVCGALLMLVSLLAGCASTPEVPGQALDIRGSGRPTVVLSSGYGMPRDTWQAVVDELSPTFAVVTSDRPGYGKQRDTGRPRDPCTIAADLRLDLQTAGLKPPYVLVGHSIGGLYQYAFARLYPQDVSGFVLLDPTHPHHWETLQTSQPALAQLLRGSLALQPRQALRNEFRQQTQCLDRVAATPALATPGRLLFSRRYTEMEKGFAPALQILQEDWKILTGVPGADLLWDSAHHIQIERPDAVAHAVRAVAGQAMSSGKAPSQVNIGARGKQRVTPGVTRQAEVSALLGQPDETHRDGGRSIWIYHAPGMRMPAAVSLVPVIGDIADLVELAQMAVDRFESIIEFDTHGVVRQARRRRVQD